MSGDLPESRKLGEKVPASLRSTSHRVTQVVHKGTGEQPPALKPTAADLSMGPSGGEGASHSATAMTVASVPQSGALISLPQGDEQRGKPEVRGRQRQGSTLPTSCAPLQGCCMPAVRTSVLLGSCAHAVIFLNNYEHRADKTHRNMRAL